MTQGHSAEGAVGPKVQIWAPKSREALKRPGNLDIHFDPPGVFAPPCFGGVQMGGGSKTWQIGLIPGCVLLLEIDSTKIHKLPVPDRDLYVGWAAKLVPGYQPAGQILVNIIRAL